MKVGATFETKGNYRRSSMTPLKGRNTLVSIPSFVNQSLCFILYMISFDVNFTKTPPDVETCDVSEYLTPANANSWAVCRESTTLFSTSWVNRPSATAFILHVIVVLIVLRYKFTMRD